MSIEIYNDDSENSISVVSDKTEKTNDGTPPLKSHFQQGGRYFLKDPESGETVNVARLTAYAEYGEQVQERVTHHEIPLLKIDAPRFLDVLPADEHSGYHGQDPDPVEVDGFPVLRAGL